MLGLFEKKKSFLGSKVRDSVTGFEGIAVAETTWLNGCVRVTLQPTIDKDGKVPDSVTFDAPQLVIVEAEKVLTGNRESGGPNTTPAQHASPSR